MPAFKNFNSWVDLLDHLRAGNPVWYQAPLDRFPSKVSAYFKGKRIRVIPWGRDCDPFLANEDHLDRFRRQVLSLKED